MKKNLSSFLFFSFIFSVLSAQHFPPNDFQSAGNPYYWKNKKPYADYWQQDVYYHIKAGLNVDSNIISGLLKLDYTNNSPDTLYYSYFHLYQEAFQACSYYHDAQTSDGGKPNYGKYESKGLGCEVEGVRSNNQNLKTIQDNTLMKVYYDEPLYPGATKTFYIKWKTYYDKGSVRRRMKMLTSFGKKQYNGAQWFPKIAAYDRKFKYTTEQHMAREFYGEFGNFDVELTFPANYIIEATGELINFDDVYKDSLWEKIQLSNFSDNPWNTNPTFKIGDDSTKKTWMFHAENVHDFAFVANPHFRIGRYDWYPNGDSTGKPVQCLAVVQEPHASGWKNAAEYTSKILEVFSRDFGMYAYPKMIVADAEDGMEYPMLTMDGGKDPGYRGLFVHEIGHNWFYGMVGSNETYRAMMDEGFTQFLTAWGQMHIDGKYEPRDSIKNKYVRAFTDSTEIMNMKVFWAYLSGAVKDEDSRINEHSDMYYQNKNYSGGYRDVYYKTASMLYNLQYVLGDELFLAAMKNYFKQWSFCHPYPEDFRKSVIDYTHADLNWFFDQWMETTKKIDYKISSVKKDTGKGAGHYLITFKRKGEMTMPLDFAVVEKNLNVRNFYVPNTWFDKYDSTLRLRNENATNTTFFAGKVKGGGLLGDKFIAKGKQTDYASLTLPMWYGWNGIRKKYTAEVYVPGAIKNVVIDPSERLADINFLNNRMRGNTKVHFDSHIGNFPDYKYYHLYMRPDIWYNAVDGVKLGFHMDGNYMNYKHKLWLTVWWNTRLLRQNYLKVTDAQLALKPFALSYNFSLTEPLDKFSKRSTWTITSKYLDGLWYEKLQFDKRFLSGINLSASYKFMRRDSGVSMNYPVYTDEWSIAKSNSSMALNLRYSKTYKRGMVMAEAGVRSSLLSTKMNYHYMEVQVKNTYSFWRLDLRTRAYVRLGTINPPDESALYFAGASGEEMYENKYSRAIGIVPQNWAGTFGSTMNHFHSGGGLNLRGYAGYLMPQNDKYGFAMPTCKGSSGASVSAELIFDRIIGLKAPKFFKAYDFDFYLFADAGSIEFLNSQNQKQWSELRIDAGIGTTLTIKKFWVLQNIKPLVIRFDVPLLVSHKPYDEPGNYLRFRYVLGIEKSF